MTNLLPGEKCRGGRRALPPADGTHRYCAYCGLARVHSETGAGTALMTLGQDVIGSRTGCILAYQTLDRPPDTIKPFDPRIGPEWQDLWAASDSPNPELALRRTGCDPSSRPGTSNIPSGVIPAGVELGRTPPSR